MKKDWDAQRKDLSEKIVEGVRTLVKSDGWVKYLETAAKFHRYSFGNQMLILMQNRHATAVAGYKKWQEFSRQVKKGEHGIKIFGHPTAAYKWVEKDDEKEKAFTGGRFWPMVSVFDVSQTEGEPLQDVVVALDGDGAEKFHESLLGYAEAEGIPVVEYAGPTTMSILDKVYGPSGATDGKKVFVNGDNPTAQQAKTLVHEFAHIKLGHLNGREVSRELKELEAESVAYIVCNACGLNTERYSFGYLASWAKGDPEVVEKAVRESGELISRVAKWIIEGVAA